MMSLADVFPRVDAHDIVQGFVPPPRFAHVRFDNYTPSPDEPSQTAALNKCIEFVTPRDSRRSWLRKSEITKPGLYLDGGFGVGKTHLLASMWHATSEPAAFASFVEITNLVGALGFRETVSALKKFHLLCIDEFELDDPGDTVLMSTLLNELTQTGTRLAVTSNTLPDRLGEGRFAADDFMREIQGLSAHFETVRIDGPDYRHRELLQDVEPSADEVVRQNAHEVPRSSLDDFSALDAHLMQVHPSFYGHMLNGIVRVHISHVQQITHQANALRWVAFIDKMYDREIPVMTSGIALTDLFAAEMLSGGYRKKYLRALSRVTALAREGLN